MDKEDYKMKLEQKLDQLQAQRDLLSYKIFLTNYIDGETAAELERIAQDYGATCELLKLFFRAEENEYLTVEEALLY